MADADKDDEHFAPESGDRDDDDQGRPEVEADPEHDADDEHYAPES